MVAVLKRIDSKGEFEPVAKIVIPTRDRPITHGQRYTLLINNKNIAVIGFKNEEDEISIVSLLSVGVDLQRPKLGEAYIEEIYDFDLLKELLG